MTTVRGRRTFFAGAIGLLVMGGFHSLAVLNTTFGDPVSPEDAEYREAANAVDLTVGPFEANAWGATQILSASYSVLAIYAGCVNLLVMRPVIESGRFRSLTGLNVMAVGLLLTIAILYDFLPPIVFGAVAFALFAASFLYQLAGPGANSTT